MIKSAIDKYFALLKKYALDDTFTIKATGFGGANGGHFSAWETFNLPKTGSKVYTIGSSPDNDIVLDNPFISGHHAQLIVFPIAIYIEDLGSKNGTMVNHHKIPPNQRVKVVTKETDRDASFSKIVHLSSKIEAKISFTNYSNPPVLNFLGQQRKR